VGSKGAREPTDEKTMGGGEKGWAGKRKKTPFRGIDKKSGKPVIWVGGREKQGGGEEQSIGRFCVSQVWASETRHQEGGEGNQAQSRRRTQGPGEKTWNKSLAV